MDPIVRFILDRVSADYVRLYRARNAPPAERYGEVWQEHAEAVVQDILYTEFRLRCETVPALSVEDFLNAHHAYRNNENIILQLLEHELEIAPADPDVKTVQSRFPHVDLERLTQTVELVQLRREWKSKKTEIAIQTAIEAPTVFSPPKNEGLAPLGDASRELFDMQLDGVSPPPLRIADTTGIWTPEQAKSIEWAIRQPEQPGVDTTTVFSLTQEQPHPPAPPMAMQSGELDESKTLTISDSLMVEKILGSGHWKDVYKAKQQSTRQFVALKHLREANETERKALIREVRTQAALTHQNIPPVFALDVLPNGQAIAVEKLVDGGRWSDSIKSRTLDDNLRILLEVANAVAFAHQQHKVIHRDLKPDNVIINDKYGEVYLIDWGLAADVSDEPSDSDERVSHVSQLNSIAGTPLYWAPEQVDGTPTRCCPATDVFLLGALLYEILTGHAPYKLCNPNKINGLSPKDIAEIRSLEVGPTLRAIRGIIIPPHLFAPERYIPEELLAVAMKSLSRLPEDRYADAGDFIEAVKRYQFFSLITSRCDQNWRRFSALRRKRDKTLDQPEALLSLTLRFLETSDIFRNVASEFQTHQIASGIITKAGATAHPTFLSAQRGEVEARTELIAMMIQSGDLTMADAQIGLVERNPLHDVEKIRAQRHRVQVLKASRNRAIMMKWLAVGLLGIFLATSTLYGYLISEQYKSRALEHHLAEEDLQKTRSVVNNFFANVADIPDIRYAGLTRFRYALLDLARQYHDDFVAHKSDDPDVIADQVKSLFNRAGIEAQFGYYHDAIEHYLMAIELGNKLVEKYPNNARYLNILAKCYKNLAVMYNQVQSPPEQILDVYLKALAISHRLVAEHGGATEYYRNHAQILHNLGVWKLEQERKDEAIQAFQSGFETLNALGNHRTLVEEELLERIRTRLLEVLDVAPRSP